ncbi:hypothetical protein RF55_20287 [Lasius niger]|uniref:Uncharacterized protein n=1 Tax=Lasius niger TaxID=67767 RepID=A0A0J7JZ37_LASNI|nr:hypothetical protein RF55_20287 [Lasius niger]
MRITELKKGSKGTVILGYDTGEELKKLKASVQAKLGEIFKVTESPRMKPKIKIVNTGEEKMKLNNDDLIVTIKKQNRIDAKNEGIYMRIVKRVVKEKRNNNNQFGRRGKEEGSVIIEADEEIYEVMLSKGKQNVG